ncbi:DUF47 domain-containing protein [Clostridium minihomine]|uniref:DUF47 domain-containing protein n=1 Tax=Clostridium minihomine TaxID=2045012 RepID=UPI000C76E14D|nr:DUF47 family protein [Clostridium minihomine]
MARKSDQYYYKVLTEGVEYCVQAAELLYETLKNYQTEEMDTRIKEMHAIEHAADLAKHVMMSKLVKEFITPIEREDIIELAQTIDDVTDGIEDVLLRMYMFHTKTIRPEALEFCTLIVSCCHAMKNMMEEFHNFSKSNTIHQMIVEINRLEEDGDKLYTDAMHALYSNPKDPIEIFTWTEIFNHFERCCDKCEDVANVVESVIMKNT